MEGEKPKLPTKNSMAFSTQDGTVKFLYSYNTYLSNNSHNTYS